MTPSASSAELIADGFFFPEGLRWRDGLLYGSDPFGHRVWTLDESGVVSTVCELTDEPLGLGWSGGGDLLIACQQSRQLMTLRNGELEVAIDLSTHLAHPLNDLLTDASGAALVGSFGFAIAPGAAVKGSSLLRVEPDGAVREAASDLIFPNGMAVTLDGTLLVAETWAYRISAFDLLPDGSLTNRRVWARFRDEPASTWDQVMDIRDAPAPDAVTVDAEGALWIGDAMGHRALRVLPGGEISDSVDVGEMTPFAVELGGADGRTLYIGGAPPLWTGLGGVREGRIWSTLVDVPSAAFARAQ